MNQSLSTTEGLIKENDRYSHRSVPIAEKHVRYSRHLSFQLNQTPSNTRSRIVIHATIRSPTNNRRQKENKSVVSGNDLHSFSTILTARYNQDKANNSYVIPNSAEGMQNVSHSLSIDKDSGRYQLLPKSIRNSWNYNEAMRYSQEPIDSLSKKTNTVNNNVGSILDGQYFPSSSTRHLNSNNSSLFFDRNRTKENKELSSNTKDFHKDSKGNKKKKNPGGCPCSCPCLLASLLTALLLCIALAVALITTLIKPQTITTTIQSTTISMTTAAITTIASTTLATTIVATTFTTIAPTTMISTTMSTSVTSTTIATTTFASTSITTTSVSTTSTSTTVSVTYTSTTATTTSCNALGIGVYNYTTQPTSYQLQIYNYTASSSGFAVLEFGFNAYNPAKQWHLDDVSVVDIAASNSELLINGNFENGTLIGWQVLCTLVNCGGTGGSIDTSKCHTGTYCYVGACIGAYDFLRQTFPVITGHTYMLQFWLMTDGHSAERAYVTIY